jgi:hypothetical protein
VTLLLINFTENFNSVRREVLYNIHIESGIIVKLLGQIKLRLNETYTEISTGTHLYDAFPVHGDLKKGVASTSLLLNSALEEVIRKVSENKELSELDGIRQDLQARWCKCKRKITFTCCHQAAGRIIIGLLIFVTDRSKTWQHSSV